MICTCVSLNYPYLSKKVCSIFKQRMSPLSEMAQEKNVCFLPFVIICKLFLLD